MIENADHSGNPVASRIMTIMVTNAEQKHACATVRQQVQAGVRHRRVINDDHFIQQFLIVDRLNGLPIATAGLSSSHVGGEVESEFDLRGLMPAEVNYLELDGPVMLPGHNPDEVLATCLDYIEQNYANSQPQALVSRISLPLGGGDKYIQSLMFYLRNSSHMCPSQARPRVPLRRGDVAYADDVILPGMLRAFLRRGACIGSEPYWDAEQGRAVILVWLEGERLFNQPFQQQPGTGCCPDSRLSV